MQRTNSVSAGKDGLAFKCSLCHCGTCLGMWEEVRADFIEAVATWHPLEFLAPILSNGRWRNILLYTLEAT